MDIKKELKIRKELVEEILSDFFPKDGKPNIIFESMNYSLNAGGKRIRPILMLETARLFDDFNEEDIYPLMASIEMIHTYSLIHDDLPCMDNDDLRRGKPTNHTVYGEAFALLAGDGLLNFAYENMIKGLNNAYNKDGYALAMSELACAAGIYGMVAGQVMDMECEDKKPNKENLDFIHNNKTGAMLRASVLCAGFAAGFNDREKEALTKFAKAIGLMFQVVDDILDITGDSKTLGKNVGSDEENNKMTYPSVYGMEQSIKKVNELEKEALESLEIFGEKAEFLKELTKYLSKRKN